LPYLLEFGHFDVAPASRPLWRGHPAHAVPFRRTPGTAYPTLCNVAEGDCPPNLNSP